VVALSAAGLGALPASVAVPRYDRSRVRVGVVHLGVGGFHRSHQAVYLDSLMNAGAGLDWGICGVGVLPGDARMRDALAGQDSLWTLLVRHPDGFVDARVVGSMVEYLLAPDDPERVVERMTDPQVRIVSLTITEGGYNTTADGGFDATAPAIVADLRTPEAPATAFGLVTEALRRRRERGVPAFTVMSCDNVPGNGAVARRAFAGHAALRDPELGRWVEQEVAFPDSMVDRITPATTDADRAELSAAFGIEDAWPVVCEPFSQWVLEDSFPAGRPPLQDAGVQLVDDVAPYELMKLRLLNAGHQVLGHVGRLAGLEYVHEACQDPLLRRLLLGYLRTEGIPTLRPVPGIDLRRYVGDLVGRFASPAVRDTLDRLRTDASDRIPKFLLPVLRENLAAGREVRHCALVLAAWALGLEGRDETGAPVEVVDARGEALVAAAGRQQEDPLALLRVREVFGDLADDERLAAAYTAELASLRARGVRPTVESLVRGEPSTPGRSRISTDG
jgi:mannitol 2-dehydrogenase